MKNNAPISNNTTISTIVICFVSSWVAFSFYMGMDPEGADGKQILLLHPIIGILFIVLLGYIRPQIALRGVVDFLMLMVCIRLFVDLSSVLMPFILGFGFAYFFRLLLDEMGELPLPGGRTIEIPRNIGRVLLFALTVGAFAILFLYIIPQIGRQSQEMSKGLVLFYRNTIVPFFIGSGDEAGALSKLAEYGGESGKQIDQLIEEYLTEKLPTVAKTGSDFVTNLLKRFSSIALGFGGFLITTFFTLLTFIYASQDLDGYVNSFIRMFPARNRNIVRLCLIEVHQNMQSFMRGQVVVVFIIAVLSIVAYTIIGVPFALIVGLLAGITNAVRTFGPFVGGAIALLSLLMGFAAGNFDTMNFAIRFVALLGVIIGVQVLDNSIISPKVMGDAVDVDPLLILFSVVVGAAVLGFWGVILAIPFIVVVKSIMTVYESVTT